MKAVRCTAKSSYTAAKLLAAAAISCAALGASAATYYWKPGAEQGLWTTIENWSTESATGAVAAELPDSDDSLAGAGDYNFDLNGGSYTLSAWIIPSDWNNHNLTVTNGTLTFNGDVSTHSGKINVDAKGKLNLNGSFNPGMYSSAGLMVNANAGGVVSVGGSVRLYNGSFAVNDGGSMTFAPSYLRFGAESHNYALAFSNAGTLTLPNGFKFDRWDIATVETGASYTLTQSGGTLNLGGPIANAPNSSDSKSGPFSVNILGGTVHVTGDVTFNVTTAYLDNSVEFNVDEGKTINLTPFTFRAGSSITKTGNGVIVLPAIAPRATISAGKLALSAATYDLAAVTFGSDAIIDLTAMGARVDSADASIESATFAATIPATAGTDVLYSTNLTILQYAKADLDASVPAGFDLVISGEALSVEAETAGSFTGNGDICDAEGWGGTIPAAGSDVSIDGADAIATYSGGDMPAWNSIEVKNGATLRIASNLTLPKIILNKNAKLEIVNSASVTLGNVADLTGVVAATPELVIPELVVEAGATLNVPGGMKFKNLDLRHFGTIAASSAGRLYFGYADANETAYFAMCSTNATISTINAGSYGDGTPCFVCPAANGLVRVYGTIELDGLTLTRVKTGSASIYDAVMVGVNNPVGTPFAVLFNNFAMSYRGYADFGGAAIVTFRNSKLTRPEWQAWSSKGRWNVNDSAKVIFDNTEHYYEYPDGNSVGWFSSVAGTEAFVLTNSTVMWSRPVGNGNSKLTVYDSYYDCAYDAYITNQMHQGEYLFLPDLFDGLGELNIPENSFCVLRALDHVTWDANDNAPERRCKVYSELDISGAGDLIVTNGVSGRYFEVIMQSAKNTCSGTLRVDSPEGYDAKLYFADGANWAGTVTAGNVALTNLVSGASASTNTFNRLALAAGTTFPIRVWKTGGVIVAHDGLNVGSYANNGGKIVLVAMAEELAPGDSFILGTVGGDSRPAVGGKWESRSENGILKVKYSSGLTVILR